MQKAVQDQQAEAADPDVTVEVELESYTFVCNTRRERRLQTTFTPGSLDVIWKFTATSTKIPLGEDTRDSMAGTLVSGATEIEESVGDAAGFSGIESRKIEAPSTTPSAAPSVAPSVVPSAAPSAAPSVAPTAAPSAAPSVSAAPSASPSVVPSEAPSISDAPSPAVTISP